MNTLKVRLFNFISWGNCCTCLDEAPCSYFGNYRPEITTTANPGICVYLIVPQNDGVFLLEVNLAVHFEHELAHSDMLENVLASTACQEALEKVRTYNKPWSALKFFYWHKARITMIWTLMFFSKTLVTCTNRQLQTNQARRVMDEQHAYTSKLKVL